MFFVHICYLLVYTAKTRTHGFLMLTSAQRFTHTVQQSHCVVAFESQYVYLHLYCPYFQLQVNAFRHLLSWVAIENQTNSYHIQW